MRETRLDRRMPRAFGVFAGISAAVFYGFTASGKQAPAVQPASRRNDLDALVTVNGQIGDICQSCHQAIMP